MPPPGVSTTTTLYAFKYCTKPYSILMLCANKYCTNPLRILKLIFCTARTELSEEVKVHGINHALTALPCPVGSYRDQEVAIYGRLLQLLQHQDHFWRMFFTLSMYSLIHMKNNNSFWSLPKPFILCWTATSKKDTQQKKPFEILIIWSLCGIQTLTSMPLYCQLGQSLHRMAQATGRRAILIKQVMLL